MTDAQIDSLLERLREYHGAERIEMIFSFDDGSEVRHISEDREQ